MKKIIFALVVLSFATITYAQSGLQKTDNLGYTFTIKPVTSTINGFAGSIDLKGAELWGGVKKINIPTSTGVGGIIPNIIDSYRVERTMSGDILRVQVHSSLATTMIDQFVFKLY